VIIGSVPTGRQATVTVTVRHAVAGSREVLAVIDTGFTGALTLPRPVIESLSLAQTGTESAMLADGSAKEFEYYNAYVEWDGAVRLISILAADNDPLVGMTLLAGYEVTSRPFLGAASR
jgi:clan AA aspartic protease